jgi:hypothetical protein
MKQSQYGFAVSNVRCHSRITQAETGEAGHSLAIRFWEVSIPESGSEMAINLMF